MLDWTCREETGNVLLKVHYAERGVRCRFSDEGRVTRNNGEVSDAFQLPTSPSYIPRRESPWSTLSRDKAVLPVHGTAERFIVLQTSRLTRRVRRVAMVFVGVRRHHGEVESVCEKTIRGLEWNKTKPETMKVAEGPPCS